MKNLHMRMLLPVLAFSILATTHPQQARADSLNPNLNADGGNNSGPDYNAPESSGALSQDDQVRDRSNLPADLQLKDFDDWDQQQQCPPPPALAPEPSSLLLLGSGLIALVGLIFRKKIVAQEAPTNFVA